MNITQQLSTLIHATQPDPISRDKARAGVVDYLAVTLPVLWKKVVDSGFTHLCQVYNGDDARTHALLLGYAGHALDYDDFHPDFRGHPSTVILPVLFALAAGRPAVNHDDFLDACVIGIEMAGRLGLATKQQHYKLGYHTTGTLGTLAATAAAARLMKADPRATAIMLGIAATQASGLRAQSGSAVKPLHAGLAAQAAVSACQLTLAGFNGQQHGVVENFFSASCAGQHDLSLISTNWGHPWRIVTPGLEFKPYASCSGTHSAADAARRLRHQWLNGGGTVNQLIDSLNYIEVAFPPGGDIAPSIRRPGNGIEARFSLEYVIAAALIYDDLTLDIFSEGKLDPRISQLAEKVIRYPDPAAQPDELNPAARFHRVTLVFHDAPPQQCEITRAESLAHPVDLLEKLRRNLADENATTIAEIIQLSQLNTPSSLTQLWHLLHTALYQQR